MHKKGWWSPLSNGNSGRPVRVFVSSAGILHSERLLVVKICRQIGSTLEINIEPLLWEGGGDDEPNILPFPAYISGEGAQAVIDDQVWQELGGCDVYVGMIWHRMGTPVGDEYKSGTEAEYRGAERERAEGGRPEILFYRKTADLPMRDVDPAQLAAAQEFASEIQEAGLMQRFEDAVDLEAQLHSHLSKAIRKVRPDLFPTTQQVPDRSSARTGKSSVPHPPAAYFAHSHTIQENFTGRVRERQQLTEWLVQSDQPPVLAIVAGGGMGKSELSWAWVKCDVLEEPLLGVAPESLEDQSTCRVPQDRKPDGVFWWSFYEHGSTFDGFLDAALAYAGSDEVSEIQEEPAADKVEALVNLLKEKRFLFVLDGFERQLRRYASLDAVYQKDDVVEVEPHERATADQRTARFLRRLAAGGIRSRIMVTSRLLPREFQGDDGKLLSNFRQIQLQDLDMADAVAFMRAEGVIGTRAEIEAACKPTGCQPLALRTLAGIILKDHQTPGDVLAAERHDLLTEPAGDRLQRVLRIAYDALDESGQDLLSQIAAFRSTASYDAISVLKDAGKEVEFDALLEDLVDRRLVLFDRERGHYDLHPLVRAYAYKRLRDKERVHERLAAYFAEFPVPDEQDVGTVEELAPLIELLLPPGGCRSA